MVIKAGDMLYLKHRRGAGKVGVIQFVEHGKDCIFVDLYVLSGKFSVPWRPGSRYRKRGDMMCITLEELVEGIQDGKATA